MSNIAHAALLIEQTRRSPHYDFSNASDADLVRMLHAAADVLFEESRGHRQFLARRQIGNAATPYKEGELAGLRRCLSQLEEAKALLHNGSLRSRGRSRSGRGLSRDDTTTLRMT